MTAAVLDEPGFRELRRFHAALIAAVGERPTDEADGALAAKRVRVRLQRTLADFGFGRAPAGGEPPLEGYLLAGLADELLLHEIDWEGRAHWDDLLLEEALFDSRIAGERFLQIADEVLNAPGGARPEIARLLLGGLLLGFRGRCRDGDAGELRRYRERLYERVTDRPFDADADAAPLLAAPRQEVRASSGPRTLPRLAPWLAAIALLFAAYLAVAHLTWRIGAADILDGSAEVVRIRDAVDAGSRSRP